MILADYRCGCTWIGFRRECIEYCAKHGEPRRLIHKIKDVPEDERGWDWQLDPDTGKRNPAKSQKR
jgi:hypothetical protein